MVFYVSKTGKGWIRRMRVEWREEVDLGGWGLAMVGC